MADAAHAVCTDPSCGQPRCLQQRVALLTEELRAAKRTIDVLVERVEQPPIESDADRFALYKTVSTLHNIVRDSLAEAAETSLDYEALVDQTPDCIMTLDEELRVSTANSAAVRALGSDGKSVVGSTLGHLLGAGSAASLIGLIWSGFTGIGESELELEDGRRLNFSVARLGGERTLLVMRDVTRVHHQQLEMRRSRRLAGAGRLAASLVEEITTPLSIVQGRISLIKSSVNNPAAVERQIAVVSEHCRRIGSVMRNLQAFIAPVPLTRAWHPLRAVIDEASSLCGRRIARLQLGASVVPSDLQVFADRDQLVHAITNLLLHLADRSPAGARVHLRARATEAGVEIAFEDPAGILPARLAAELRSPYADGDRQMDPDIGLGVAIAWAIAQDHEGWMAVSELRGGGLVLRLGLPGPVSTDALAPSAAPKRHILVVDDDQLLRETVSWMLADAGYGIAVVASAEEALEHLNRNVSDAVLVDIGLPDMRGDKLVDVIGERWPELGRRVLVVSGLLQAPREGEAYLQKPFTRGQLLGSLERLFQR